MRRRVFSAVFFDGQVLRGGPLAQVPLARVPSYRGSCSISYASIRSPTTATSE
jgi:hypothetical protein